MLSNVKCVTRHKAEIFRYATRTAQSCTFSTGSHAIERTPGRRLGDVGTRSSPIRLRYRSHTKTCRHSVDHRGQNRISGRGQRKPRTVDHRSDGPHIAVQATTRAVVPYPFSMPDQTPCLLRLYSDDFTKPTVGLNRWRERCESSPTIFALAELENPIGQRCSRSSSLIYSWSRKATLPQSTCQD